MYCTRFFKIGAESVHLPEIRCHSETHATKDLDRMGATFYIVPNRFVPVYACNGNGLFIA
ncbi:MAG: hypothetical protein IJM23_10970, partial [Lachnospiraceae bacterium]|nr:hypothetical protein [Lachnospiraceae bacterium]